MSDTTRAASQGSAPLLSEAAKPQLASNAALPRRAVLARGFWAGIIGVVPMLLLMWLFHGLFGHFTLPQVIDPIVIKLLPGQAFEQGIQFVGQAAHPLAITVIIVGIILVGGLFGLLYATLFGKRTAIAAADASDAAATSGLVPALLKGVGFAVALWLLVYGALLPLLERLITYDAGLDLYRGVGPFGTNVGNSSFTQEGTVGFTLMTLATFVLFGLVLAGVFDHDVRETTRNWHAKLVAQAEASPTRRRVLRQAASGVATVAGAVLAYSFVNSKGGFGLLKAGQDGPEGANPSGPTNNNSPITSSGGVTNTGAVTNTGGVKTSGGVTNTQSSSATPTAAPANLPTGGDAVPMDTPEPDSLPSGADTPVPSSGVYNGNGPQVNSAPLAATSPTAVPATAVPSAATAGMPTVATAANQFYHVSKNTVDPVIAQQGWTMKITGEVSNPLTLTFDDLTKQPSLYRYITLSCISNPVGGNLIGNGKWKGTPLSALLKKAGIKPTGKRVVFICGDDYTDSIPVDVAMHDYNMLAWELNGQYLLSKSGAPVRALIPGIFGMKNAKWIREIRVVTDANYKGFWASQGWDNAAPTRTMAIFYLPKRFTSVKAGAQTIGGIAFAGDRGIKKVEVSLDNGKTWQSAQLQQPLSRYSWVLWTLPWNPKAGKYQIACRATDGSGKLQGDISKDAYPSGVEGYDRLDVTVS